MKDDRFETFTDFMVDVMAAQPEVSQALVILRREDGTIGYRTYQQEFADSLGMIDFTQLSMRNDLVRSWNRE